MAKSIEYGLGACFAVDGLKMKDSIRNASPSSEASKVFGKIVRDYVSLCYWRAEDAYRARQNSSVRAVLATADAIYGAGQKLVNWVKTGTSLLIFCQEHAHKKSNVFGAWPVYHPIFGAFLLGDTGVNMVQRLLRDLCRDYLVKLSHNLAIPLHCNQSTERPRFA